MPQISAITINDGSGTPVAYTFTPMGKDDKGVFWFEQTTPTPTNRLGAARIGYKQVSDPLGSQLKGVTKVIYSIFLPTLETLATNDAGIVPAPTVAYEEIARLEFRVADRSSAAERKNARVFAANFLAHAMAVANIDTMQPSYS